MCGLVGILLYGKLDKEQEDNRKKFSLQIATELLRETETRGSDATGICSIYEDGNYYGLKMGIKSSQFTERYGDDDTEYKGYMKKCVEKEEKLQMILGHCRKNSIGNTWDNVNNHPITVNNTIGIHNGTLKNHTNIFKALKSKTDYNRKGEVDSEAIIAIVDFYTQNGKNPLTLEYMEKTAAALDGTYTILTCNANNPYQVGALRSDRPMELCFIKELKILIITSDEDFTKKVLKTYSRNKKLFGIGPVNAIGTVSTKTIPNKEAMVFNLLTEITEATTITDLYDNCDIGRVKSKYKSIVEDVNNSMPVVVKPKVIHTSYYNRKTDSIEDPITACMLKNKDISKCNLSTEAYKYYGHMTFSNDIVDKKGDIIKSKSSEQEETIVTNNKDTKCTLSLVNEIDYMYVQDTSATILCNFTTNKEYKTAYKNESYDDAYEVTEEDYEVTEEEDNGVMVTVDNVGSYHSSFLEIARDMSEEIELYEDNIDMSFDLDIRVGQDVNSIPMYALVNNARIKAFSEGYYDALCNIAEKMSVRGVNLDSILNGSDNSNSSTPDKADNKEKHIRTLKCLSYIMSDALNLKNKDIDKDLILAFSKHKNKINTDDLNAVCSEGDFLNYTPLAKIMHCVKNENKIHSTIEKLKKGD